MKGKIIAINEIIMEDFTTMYKVEILFEETPPFKLGDCEVNPNA